MSTRHSLRDDRSNWNQVEYPHEVNSRAFGQIRFGPTIEVDDPNVIRFDQARS
jgi:hypothetical protein